MLGLMQHQPLLISSLLTPRRAPPRRRRGGLQDSRDGGDPPHHLGRDRAPGPPAGAGAARASASARRPGRHAGLERLPPSGDLLRRAPAWGRSATRSIRGCTADDIAYIINHAGDSVLFVDTSFAAADRSASRRAVGEHVRAVVMMTDAGAHAGARRCRRACALLCYDDADGRGGRGLRLAGVRREHRQRALLHLRHHRAAERRAVQPPLHRAARATRINVPDVLGLRAIDRVLPVRADVPCQRLGHPLLPRAMAGAALMLPGRHLDGASLARAAERGARHHQPRRADGLARRCCSTCATSGERLDTVKRIMTGGSAVPAAADRGVRRANTA